MKMLCSLMLVGTLTLSPITVSALDLHSIVQATGSLYTWWTQPHPPFNLATPKYVEERAEATGLPNLVQLASDLGLNTCVKRMKEVGMDQLLNHEGWYTLFCPTDEGFAHGDIYPGDMKLVQKMRLRVARGLYNSSDFHNEAVFKSLLPQRYIRINKYEISKETQIRTANGQEIISMNHKARNGYIHILKTMMGSVYDRAGTVISELEECCPQNSEVIDLMKYSGLYKELDTANPITFLAPTNEAFINLHPEFLIHLKKNRTLLNKVLKAHVIPGTWYTVGLVNGIKLRTWSNEVITISKDDEGLIKFSNAKAGIIVDINATNGVTHAVQSLIIPSSVRAEVQELLAKLHSKY